jgi:DNA end-binding protein Ku
MKVMWKGAISFGLVTIPVRVFLATEEHGVGFHQLHDEDNGRIHYQRVCAECGQQVGLEHIVRGHEIEKERYVVVTEAEMTSLPVVSSHTIDIAEFVDIREIDPVYFKRSYYLVPDAIGVKAYQLLRQAMREEGRVAVAKVAFRDKEHLATLRVRGDVLVLETMYWPDEIRVAEFSELTEEVPVKPQEVEMARSLICNLTETWNPAAYHDEYREALLDLIERKAAGEEVVVASPPEPAPVIDLMDALKASVDAAKKQRAS